MFLDSELAQLQEKKAVLVTRCAMRRAAMALCVAQARAGLRGVADGVKMGMTVAEMLMSMLKRSKNRDS